MHSSLITGTMCYNWKKKRKLLRKPEIQGNSQIILLTHSKVNLVSFEKEMSQEGELTMENMEALETNPVAETQTLKQALG